MSLLKMNRRRAQFEALEGRRMLSSAWPALSPSPFSGTDVQLIVRAAALHPLLDRRRGHRHIRREAHDAYQYLDGRSFNAEAVSLFARSAQEQAGVYEAETADRSVRRQQRSQMGEEHP